jgi:hypothetical protein
MMLESLQPRIYTTHLMELEGIRGIGHQPTRPEQQPTTRRKRKAESQPRHGERLSKRLSLLNLGMPSFFSRLLVASHPRTADTMRQSKMARNCTSRSRIPRQGRSRPRLLTTPPPLRPAVAPSPARMT